MPTNDLEQEELEAEEAEDEAKAEAEEAGLLAPPPEGLPQAPAPAPSVTNPFASCASGGEAAGGSSMSYPFPMGGAGGGGAESAGVSGVGSGMGGMGGMGGGKKKKGVSNPFG